jgi:hypothetical protein
MGWVGEKYAVIGARWIDVRLFDRRDLANYRFRDVLTHARPGGRRV